MTPVRGWKSSYRLIFGAQAEPTLEGWAIVDNTSGDDWNNVKLSVVSGRPISFITQLYEPRYVDRPHAELAENQCGGAGGVSRGDRRSSAVASAAGACAAQASGVGNATRGGSGGTGDNSR